MRDRSRRNYRFHTVETDAGASDEPPAWESGLGDGVASELEERASRLGEGA
jgi:hypothetical protein